MNAGQRRAYTEQECKDALDGYQRILIDLDFRVDKGDINAYEHYVQSIAQHRGAQEYIGDLIYAHNWTPDTAVDYLLSALEEEEKENKEGE